MMKSIARQSVERQQASTDIISNIFDSLFGSDQSDYENLFDYTTTTMGDFSTSGWSWTTTAPPTTTVFTTVETTTYA